MPNHRCRVLVLRVVLALGLPAGGLLVPAEAAVVINEIHYHPVEEGEFDEDGYPMLNLYEDIHEFVELHNPAPESIVLAGWELTGDVDYRFPADAVIAAGGYLVVARHPDRLAAVPAYGLTVAELQGPYLGQLSNNRGTIRLRNGVGDVIDSVSFSGGFPWAISADALGAGTEFTGLNPRDFQYRGRSLERVSAAHFSNDPANWLASPLPGNPSPGRANTVTRAVPQPVVIAFSVRQEVDGAAVIRRGQPVRVEAVFSGSDSLTGVSVEWFVEDINLDDEPRVVSAMTAEGPANEFRFAATLPGQPDRQVIRYRFRANRGAGDEVVSPRADDPFAWHACFVSPVRTATVPIYDVFISAAGLSQLNWNISQSPRRVTAPDPPGYPRESWNATEPALFVHEGVVYEMRMRHHGSRYNRNAGRNSLKFKFPRYQLFNGYQGVFETDKGNDFVVGHGIFDAAGLPTSRVRYVDLYLNGTYLRRLEQEEMDDRLGERYHEEQARANPGSPVEPPGEFYKSTGTINASGEGPYGVGDEQRLPARSVWTELDRYQWTYGIQSADWKGSIYVKNLIDGLWAARGDSHAAPNPNVPALRAYLEQVFDLDETLTYLAIINWMGPWDDTTQNHFLWQRRNGLWGMLPWDFDAMFGRGDNAPASASIYMGEVGDPNNNYRGPNWLKDSFFKTFREEYKARLFLLNNTLLHPTNLTALGFGSIRSFADQRFASVNAQCGLGVFQRPTTPVNLSPAAGTYALPPATLQISPYGHSASPAPTHASTTWWIRSANASYREPVFKLASSTNLSSLPIPFEALTFGQTYYWQAMTTDADGHPSVASAETGFTFGAGPRGNPVINEVAADNRGSVVHAGAAPDWLELFNNSDQAIDLGGLSLSDDVLAPDKFVFPPGTSLGPREHLVLWCDQATNAPGLHTGFSLDDRGELVALYAPSGPGWVVRDFASFGVQIGDHTVGRAPDGAEGFTLCTPTPGTANVVAATGSPADLRLNEWMASPTSGDDWFEIHNPNPLPVALAGLELTDDPTLTVRTPIAPLSFVAGGGFVRWWASGDAGRGAGHAGFRLSANGEVLALCTAGGLGLIDTVAFGPQVSGQSQGRLPDGALLVVDFPDTASPGARNHLPLEDVVIHEVLTHTDPPLEDAIELHNTGVGAVDIGGWYLSDDVKHLTKFAIPVGTVLPPGGYWVGYEADFNRDPGSLSSFALSSARGDDVYLSAVDGAGQLTGYREHVDFGAAENGVSFGRHLQSSGMDFTALSRITLGMENPASVEEFRTGHGAANAGPKVGPVVISEIMYHPPDLAQADNTRDEFLELVNLTSEPVPLFDPLHPGNRWRLRDAVSFTFPSNLTLAPQGRILVVSFDPATNLTAATEFRNVYGLSAAVPLYGPYVGKLDNGGESVELVRPDAPQTTGPDLGLVPEILVDRVRYWDAPPWPLGADGAGRSLQRIQDSAYGNDAANWWAQPPSPGGRTGANLPPIVTLMEPAGGAVYTAPVDVWLEAVASDTDGSVQRVEFLVDGVRVGAALQAPHRLLWRAAVAGRRRIAAQATDDSGGSSLSPPVEVFVVPPPAPPELVSGPQSQTVIAGHSVAFAVEVTGTTPLSYQWQFNGEDISGATAAGYTLTDVQPSAAGSYSVVVRNALGMVTSDAAELIVLELPYLTLHPQSVTVPVRATARFSTAAGGTAPLRYQWQFNGQDLPGATGDSHTVYNVQPADAGAYRLVITNAAGRVTSQPATLGLVGVLTNDVVLVPAGAIWRYRDTGEDLGTAWQVPAFDDSAWGSGRAELGYGDNGNETTPVGFGPDPNNKYPTTYFRHGFVLPDAGGVQELNLRVMRDDGVVVHLNGAEAWRDNMPPGPVAYGTYAAGTIGGADESTFYPAALNPGWLTEGLNLLAVEVHQSLPNSSDLSFDLALEARQVVMDRTDSDGDGMPDHWEDYAGLNWLGDDSQSDRDEDGASNLDEYRAGTDPADASSVLSLEWVEIGQGLAVRFLAISGIAYELEWVSDLAAATWQPLAEIEARPDTRTEELSVPLDPGVARFLRLRVTPTP